MKWGNLVPKRTVEWDSSHRGQAPVHWSVAEHTLFETQQPFGKKQKKNVIYLEIGLNCGSN